MKRSILLPLMAALLCFATACAPKSNEGGTVVANSEDALKQMPGRDLFMRHCASCHKSDVKMVGPALAGARERYPQSWVYTFVKNSPELIASGDSLANAVFEQNAKMPMTAFPQLSNQQIDDILDFADKVAESKK